MRRLPAPVFVASYLAFAMASACGGGSEGATSDQAQNAAPLTAPDPNVLLDVNDVSFLFGFDNKTRAPIPNLPVDALWPAKIFGQVTSFGPAQTGVGHVDLDDDSRKLGNWRIYGMRVDPCSDFTSCTNVQIRFIAQPISTDTKAPHDTAAHLVFTAPAALANPIVARLQKIKALSKAAGKNTDGVPLREHPGLQQPGAVADEVTQFVKDFVTPQAAPLPLLGVAFQGIQNGTAPWVFYVGTVTNGDWTVQNQPVSSIVTQTRTLSPAPDGVAFAVDPLPPRDGTTRSTAWVLQGHPTATESNFLHAVDNPISSPNFPVSGATVKITDCVSCHTAGNAIARSNDTGVTNGESADRYRVPSGITGYVGLSYRQRDAGFDQSQWVIRNFGRNGVVPSISNRAATESARVVDLVNTTILHAKGPKHGPGKDCSDASVWRCFVHDTPPMSPRSSLSSECLSLCK